MGEQTQRKRMAGTKKRYHKTDIAPTRVTEAIPFNAIAFIDEYGDGSATYRNHSIVCTQGDPADCAFYIQKGEVKLTVVSEQGKEAVVSILGAGDLCGEDCLNGQPLRVYTITTLSECIIARLQTSSVLRAIKENQAFYQFFMHYLLAKNIQLKERLTDHLLNSSEKRLAHALLLLAKFGMEKPEEKALPKIDQETLANLIGTTRGRVNYFMNKFRRLGLIEYSGGEIRVHGTLLKAVSQACPDD